MKTKTLLSIILFGTYSFVIQAQGFQKSFGRVFENENTDQQELYSMCNVDSESLLVSGTFKNINTFPEIAFYGAVSKVNKTGAIEWYKGYLPTDFIPFESFFITSILKSENGDSYCVGSFLSMESRTGYILMKLNANGEVVFSKKIRDDEYLEIYPKAVLKDGFIYAALFDKIVKFDLNGEVIEAKKFQYISFRDINLDNNNIILTGQYIDTNPDATVNIACPVLTLDSNLQLISGNLYTTDSFETGSIYGQSIIASSTNQIIVGGPGGAYFSTSPNGQVLWANIIPQFSYPTPADGYNIFWDLQESSDGMVIGLLEGFFSSSDDVIIDPPNNTNEEEFFQHYSALCKINPTTGLVSFSKDIKAGHFEGINHIQANNLLLDNDNIYSGGTTSDDYQYKVNYIHKTGLNDIGCGEAERSFTIESWADQILAVVDYPSSLISPADLIVSTIDMFNVDIPVNYENQSCNEILSIEEQIIHSKIVIHPNPVDNFFNVETNFSITEVKVFDVLGKEFKVQKLSESSYDFSTLSAGIYFVQVKDTQNNIVTQKVLKK